MTRFGHRTSAVHWLLHGSSLDAGLKCGEYWQFDITNDQIRSQDMGSLLATAGQFTGCWSTMQDRLGVRVTNDQIRSQDMGSLLATAGQFTGCWSKT